MLLLFDIDGTLVDTGGAGRRALSTAIHKVAGVDGALKGVRLHGSTDPVILDDAFRQHLGRPLAGDDEWRRVIGAYLAELEIELENSGPEYTVLPGAEALPLAARSAGRYAVGLATGNVEAGAELKLSHGGLWSLFDFGGYGSDASDRTELVRRGIERGQTIAEQRYNRRFVPDEIVVLGDTEKDVAAAHAAGARAIGVLAGSRHRDALLAAGADLVVESLMDSKLWAFLELEPPIPTTHPKAAGPLG